MNMHKMPRGGPLLATGLLSIVAVILEALRAARWHHPGQFFRFLCLTYKLPGRCAKQFHNELIRSRCRHSATISPAVEFDGGTEYTRACPGIVS